MPTAAIASKSERHEASVQMEVDGLGATKMPSKRGACARMDGAKQARSIACRYGTALLGLSESGLQGRLLLSRARDVVMQCRSDRPVIPARHFTRDLLRAQIHTKKGVTVTVNTANYLKGVITQPDDPDAPTARQTLWQLHIYVTESGDIARRATTGHHTDTGSARSSRNRKTGIAVDARSHSAFLRLHGPQSLASICLASSTAFLSS
jgi:hypothetical protein